MVARLKLIVACCALALCVTALCAHGPAAHGAEQQQPTHAAAPEQARACSQCRSAAAAPSICAAGAHMVTINPETKEFATASGWVSVN